jgi:hypothetical protein
MAFDWDVANPDDDDVVAAYPTNERAFRTAARGAVNVEHDADEGRHTFGRGDHTARDAITTWANGAVWWSTEQVSGQTLLQLFNGSAWLETNYGLLDVSQPWTAIQSAPYVAMGTTSSALDLDWSDGHYQKFTMNGALTLGAGTNKPAANQGATIVLELTQDGTGGRTLAYNAEYKFQFGTTPTLTTTIGAVDQLILTLMSDGNVDVVVKSDVK